MYCTHCGFKLDENAVFCSNCGHKTGRQPHRNRDFAQDIHSAYNNVMSKPKSRLIAALLAIFLGGLGIHDFYLGYSRKGIIHLMMFVFFMSFFSWLWAVYEAVMILTGRTACDGWGMPLTD